jgi:hypothetical protein
MANQDSWARPLAKTLVDAFRVTSCDYIRRSQTYDPALGEPVVTEQLYPAAGAVEQISQANEEGGAGDSRSVVVWVDMEGIGDIWPTTLDQIQYQGTRWKVTNVDPAFAGDQRYAVKITARAS